ncbi:MULTISPECIES: hypothetical protein [Nocardia]|uniref:hypothetical protein n=1 Tax=Nocardia TaxID=1817 RepID=UPI000BEFACF7|nr:MULTISPECIES: hypothetical protein [Nocardia]MBF6187633.1 hypothetical protein [Nocardia farcinica]MBF6313231.1 hypothetical protein [Nocardia farcinica]MBF6409599.1 hypothetical protein [Nocardia farcinica]PEH77585.1 hypothetical protein CRM89_17660 [Nocardia sp. FDAARGOS_372]UEX22128.1 hypothetical protein LMJ57_24640 [Nocardia farcinica]
MSDEAELWRHHFGQIRFFVQVARDNLEASPYSKGVAERTTKEGLKEGVFPHLLEERDRKAIYSSRLKEIVQPVLDAVIAFLNSPFTTPKLLVDSLNDIDSLAGTAIAAIDSMPDDEEVEQVIEEFETRYVATLATALSAHRTLAQVLAARRPTDGEYFDVGKYAFTKTAGPGRIHVADLNNAMDSGMNSVSMKRGWVTYERFPPIQIMTYGQWFAYIQAIWDEWYRPRLADAYSRRLGENFVKSDIKSQFMAELNKIRNDVIHNRSRVKQSANNKILNWANSDGLVGMTTERMVGLRTMFPRADLLTAPVHGDAPKSQNMPWTADVQLIDSVKKRLADLGLTKRQMKDIGDEMIALWLAAHPAPDGSSGS